MNRDKGDLEAAGFYNIRPKNLMKSKAVSLHLDCILLLLILTLANHFRESMSIILKQNFYLCPKARFLMGYMKYMVIIVKEVKALV